MPDSTTDEHCHAFNHADGFPPDEGKRLAEELIKLGKQYDQVTVDLTACNPVQLISAFFTSVLQTIHDQDPGGLQYARRIGWMGLKFGFQQANVERWMRDFEPVGVADPRSIQILQLQDPTLLERLTADGWDFCGTVDIPDTDWTGIENGFPITRPRSVTKLIMAQPRTWTLRDLQLQLYNAAVEKAELVCDNEHVRKDLDELKVVSRREADRLGEKAKNYVAAHELRQQELDDALQRQRRLEADMAKVRSAIGDLKWNEIVGSD